GVVDGDRLPLSARRGELDRRATIDGYLPDGARVDEVDPVDIPAAYGDARRAALVGSERDGRAAAGRRFHHRARAAAALIRPIDRGAVGGEAIWVSLVRGDRGRRATAQVNLHHGAVGLEGRRARVGPVDELAVDGDPDGAVEPRCDRGRRAAADGNLH